MRYRWPTSSLLDNDLNSDDLSTTNSEKIPKNSELDQIFTRRSETGWTQFSQLFHNYSPYKNITRDVTRWINSLEHVDVRIRRWVDLTEEAAVER